MPTYEYGCIKCGHKFDVFTSIGEKEKGLKLTCPKCKSSNVTQIFGNINFVMSRGAKSPNEALRKSGGCGPSPLPGCCR